MSELDTNMMDFRELRAEVERLRAELRARLDDASQFCDKSIEKMTTKIDKLKARLAWFERYREAVNRALLMIDLSTASAEISSWESVNPDPKPSEGTCYQVEPMDEAEVARLRAELDAEEGT